MSRLPMDGPAAPAHARLVVVSDADKGHVYPLVRPRVTIGRGIKNDIITADPRASRYHAELRWHPFPPQYQLIDTGSTNGTWVNGRRVTQAELHDEDFLQIGDFSLIFQLGGDQERSPTAQATSGQAGPTRASADVVDLRRYASVVIGRDAANDMVLEHPQVSRRHARLRVLPDVGVHVYDLNSTNGTFIDGQQVHGTGILHPGAILTVGPFRLLFSDGLLIKGSEDGTVRIDCLGLSKTATDGSVILNDITFSILPREFVALVGGSGAGKSTLLDALSGVRPASKGEVRYNGTDYYAQMASFRSAIGYVPQDDIVPIELTVERALYYAARLRLPDDTSDAEVHARIDEVLDDLRLSGERHKPINILSGGQRKRVSIGAELLSAPTLFFLDEPTSGLDPGLEAEMMELLHALAKQGRTIVLITHATQNIDMCHNIAFLARGGYLAYYGPPGAALKYFGVDKFSNIYTNVEEEPMKEVLQRRFRASPWFEQNISARLVWADWRAADAVDEAGGRRAAPAKSQAHSPAARQVSDFRQFALLSRRYTETLRRDRRNLVTLLVQAPIIALMIGIIFHGPIFDTTPLTAGGTGDNTMVRRLLFLLAMVAVWFGTANSAREIVKELAIYSRERRISLRLIPYIASKFVVLTGLSLMQNLFLLWPLAAAGVDLLALPSLYIALVLGSVAGIGMGLIISAQASNPDRASSLVPVVLIPQIIFAGVIVSLNDYWLGLLISHLVMTKWVYHALGALSDADNIPIAKQLVKGFPPELAPQLTANNPALRYDAADNAYYLLPTTDAEFSSSPLIYLAILGLFITASLLLIVIFQRRKDTISGR